MLVPRWYIIYSEHYTQKYRVPMDYVGGCIMKAVVDAGILEGEFCYNIALVACVKNFEATPNFDQNHAHF